ncbi:hypothetical protein TIFTF001_018612 [Ficus carica]|uniref:Uncharacterized protein n=1 Tax=Ficus carica TaxID=3494 RepID=A0AA88DAX3_FICCA|nr:hypothetical protein TIFTF001_018612 [Ficus carica]
MVVFSGGLRVRNGCVRRGSGFVVAMQGGAASSKLLAAGFELLAAVHGWERAPISQRWASVADRFREPS